MSDYYIGVDREGRPYIAHAFWNRKKGSSKKDHKYIAKIGEGAKARYFYTKQELDAYYNSLKGKGKDAVDKAKSSVDRMKDEFNKKREDAITKHTKIEEYDSSASARLASGKGSKNLTFEEISPETKIRETIIPETKIPETKITEEKTGNTSNVTKGTMSRIKDAGKKAVDTVKDKAGLDERENYKKAKDDYDKAIDASDEAQEKVAAVEKRIKNGTASGKDKRDLSPLREKYLKTVHDYFNTRDKMWDARNEYEKTALGKLELAKETLPDKIEDAKWELFEDNIPAVKEMLQKKVSDIKNYIGKDQELEKRVKLGYKYKNYHAYDVGTPGYYTHENTPGNVVSTLNGEPSARLVPVTAGEKDRDRQRYERAKKAYDKTLRGQINSLKSDLKDKKGKAEKEMRAKAERDIVEFNQANTKFKRMEERAKSDPSFRMTKEYRDALEKYNRTRDNLYSAKKKLEELNNKNAKR